MKITILIAVCHFLSHYNIMAESTAVINNTTRPKSPLKLILNGDGMTATDKTKNSIQVQMLNLVDLVMKKKINEEKNKFKKLNKPFIKSILKANKKILKLSVLFYWGVTHI